MEALKSEEFVISGMSGRFPESETMEKFWEHLIEGKDMVTENSQRWNMNAYNMPTRMGKIPLIEKFDANFFGVSGTQANKMDPKTRILLEKTHEAILDAGLSPKSLNGSRTGVFIANSFAEAFQTWVRSEENPSGHYITGSHPSTLANRISYTFNFNGPSCVIDSACSASFSALQYALLALKNGLCDSVIVGSANINTLPLLALAMSNLNMLSIEGKCKTFGSDCDGFARAEAAVVLYICSKDVAKRSYCSIVGMNCNNDGYKPEGISYPSTEKQKQLLHKVYADAGVNPLDVGYVEAHGTGTKVGDPKELEALAEVFCPGRQGPLLVGSVKSNMGHAEQAAGFCSISKVILARLAGILPPNLHFKTPNPGCIPLIDGRIQVVTEVTPFQGGLIGINSFGMGGTNAHVILRFDCMESLWNQSDGHCLNLLEGEAEIRLIQPENINSHGNRRFLRAEWSPGRASTLSKIPTMILASGRTQAAVEYFLKKAVQHKSNLELVGLLHEIGGTESTQNPFLGFAMTNSETESLLLFGNREELQRVVWYVYTGLGSQWIGMCRDVLRFKMFQNSVQLSSVILKKQGFDLFSVLQTQDLSIMNNLLNAMVSITAFQIALTDLLASLDILPGGIVGHSLGESACGYSDGCLTQEQTLMVTFCRARAIMESNLPAGRLASVGLSWEGVQNRCPADIYPAIHNTENNVTVSGPPNSIHNFLDALIGEGYFAKEVKYIMYAFHSPYLRGCENLMLKLFKEIIPVPTRRSQKWLSTSVPVCDWGSDLAEFCSAEYQVNNAMSPVYLYPVLQYVPTEAVVLEIGPHCFLQSFLKQSLKSIPVLGLVHCKEADNAVFLLKSLGAMFLAGIAFNVSALYKPVRFPISSEVPSISSWVKWDHSLSWEVPYYKNEISPSNGTKFSISLSTHEVFAGHGFQNKAVFPATGYLWLAWRALGKQKNIIPEKLPICMENISFKRMTVLHQKAHVDFHVSIFRESGLFEITEGDEVVCDGRIRHNGRIHEEMFSKGACAKSVDVLSKEDFYKLMRLRGYEYKGLFQGVHQVETEGKWADLEWNEDWVCFLDCMLQTAILGMPLKELVVPIRLEAVTIDPVLFKENVCSNPGVVTITRCKYLDVLRCPGIQIRGLKPSTIPTQQLSPRPAITVQKFCSYFDQHHTSASKNEVMQFFIGIAVDNSYSFGGIPFVLTEMLHKPNLVRINLKAHLFLRFETYEYRLVQMDFPKAGEMDDRPSNCQTFKSAEDLTNLPRSNVMWMDCEEDLLAYQDLLLDNGFIILSALYDTNFPELELVAKKYAGTEALYFLLRKIPRKLSKVTLVSMDLPEFAWVDVMKEKLKSLDEGHRLFVLSMSGNSGIIGLMNCLLKEPGGDNIRCIHVNNTLDFNPQDNTLIPNDIFKKDLVFNVYKNGSWGSYAHFSLQDAATPRISAQAIADIKSVGDFTSLCWIQSPCCLYQREYYNIHFAALNFKDIMYASGKLSKCAFPQELQQQECLLGIEFSGTYRGQRVCGMSGSKCLATVLDHAPTLVFAVPEQWSLAEAATVPVAYTTALYSLLIRGSLRQGETVLIHSGSGGVGLAAITIALSMNCVVFTTAGSASKRDFLKSMFPELLQKERILDSSATHSFEQQILERTKGRGVDVVLNSLCQEKLQASLRCLGTGGRFLEIGKYDIFNNTAVGMAVLLKSVNIQGIHLDHIFAEESYEQTRVQELVQKFIDEGQVKPLPYTSFNHDKLEDAFRYFASRRHVGKVIVKLRDSSLPARIAAIPRTYFEPHKTYIIIGGLGGMGLEIVNWMIERGAQKLYIVSRSGVTTSYQNYMVNKWRRSGATIVHMNTNISIRSEVSKLLQEVITKGPLGGVFNLAIVLRDAIFVNQSPQFFQFVSECKASATLHFDALTRLFAPRMDYFVVFSSVISGRGNPGQSNYGYANSVMERICERRKIDGFHALAIQWGPVAEVGSMAKLFPGRNMVSGVVAQPISSCISTLDLLLQQGDTVVSSVLLPEGESVSAVSNKTTLAETVADILGVQDISKVDHNTTLTDLGMDSIMAAQVKRVIQTRKNILLPTLAYGDLTFKYLLGLE